MPLPLVCIEKCFPSFFELRQVSFNEKSHSTVPGVRKNEATTKMNVQIIKVIKVDWHELQSVYELC